jgi:hypothetical protein
MGRRWRREGRDTRVFAEGAFTWQWSVGVNWPEGFLEFDSTGFTQALRGPIITTSRQVLEPHQRQGASA